MEKTLTSIKQPRIVQEETVKQQLLLLRICSPGEHHGLHSRGSPSCCPSPRYFSEAWKQSSFPHRFWHILVKMDFPAKSQSGCCFPLFFCFLHSHYWWQWKGHSLENVFHLTVEISMGEWDKKLTSLLLCVMPTRWLLKILVKSLVDFLTSPPKKVKRERQLIRFLHISRSLVIFR